MNKEAVAMKPNNLNFSPPLPGALGYVANPQNIPNIAPPKFPDQDTLSEDEVSAKFKKINSTTIKIRIHLTFSSSGLTEKAFQFTKNTAKIPVKTPEIAMYAPTL
jgi:hypothetical protein